jgi:hypothetical protein
LFFQEIHKIRRTAGTNAAKKEAPNGTSPLKSIF